MGGWVGGWVGETTVPKEGRLAAAVWSSNKDVHPFFNAKGERVGEDGSSSSSSSSISSSSSSSTCSVHREEKRVSQ